MKQNKSGKVNKATGNKNRNKHMQGGKEPGIAA
jgi:hypothetical protein